MSDTEGPVKWAVGAVKALSLGNLLTLAILAVIAIPGYFSWKFMTDEAFRHEFMSTTRVVAADVPCQVVQGNLGGADRITVLSAYELKDDIEHMIALRTTKLVPTADYAKLCEMARKEVNQIKYAIEVEWEKDNTTGAKGPH